MTAAVERTASQAPRVVLPRTHQHTFVPWLIRSDGTSELSRSFALPAIRRLGNSHPCKLSTYRKRQFSDALNCLLREPPTRRFDRHNVVRNHGRDSHLQVGLTGVSAQRHAQPRGREEKEGPQAVATMRIAKQNARNSQEIQERKSNAPARTRTLDPLIKSQLLYRLSYKGKEST
jgi:hypothetical protein